MSEHTASPLRDELGRYGLWVRWDQISPDDAAEIERLGYGAIWLGGSPAADLRTVDQLLDATTTLRVATGIVNIWRADPRETAESFHRIEAAFPGRFVLGVGAGHRESTAEYRKPMEAIVDYLDVLDAAGVPRDRLVLAALGPRMLRLAAERTAGAHPYLVPASYVAEARRVLGPAPYLAPELKIVVGRHGDEARAIGRPPIANPYLKLANYVSNLKRLGYDDADIEDDGSDRLIDDLLAYGDPSEVAAGIDRFLEAGADHVCVQVLPGGDSLVADLTPLAGALGISGS